MRRLFVLCCAGACLLLSRAASADGSTTAAQTLFEEGRRLMQAGDYAAACEKLAESQRLDPGAGTLLNLAACYEKREQLATAWVTYTEAASDADRSNRPEWVKKARDRASALQPILTTLTIAVGTKTEGLEVLRDGHTLASAEYGVKVPIDGGEHLVEARAPGYETWTKRVTAPAKNGALVVSVPKLERKLETKAATPAAIPDRPAGHTQRVAGASVGIAGVVGLGLGGLFTSLAISKHNDAKGNCTRDETLCNADGLAQYDSAGTMANAATVSFIAGGIFLVGGVVLYLTAPKSNAAAAFLNEASWTF